MSLIDLKTVQESLVVQQKELIKLLATETKNFKSAIASWQTEMQEYVKQSPYNDFGEYLYKILGGFVNFKKTTSGTLGASKKFFVEPMIGRKRKLQEDELFPTFSKDFERVVASPKKRVVVHDFVVFKAAVAKALNSFQSKVIKPSVPVKFIETGDVVFYDGVIRENSPRTSDRHFYIKSSETVMPDLLTISFQEFPEYVYLEPKRASSFNYRNYIMVLTVFKRLASNGALQPVDMVQVDFNPEPIIHEDRFKVLTQAELLYTLATAKRFDQHKLAVEINLQFNVNQSVYTIRDAHQTAMESASLTGDSFRDVLPESEGSVDGRNGINSNIVVNWADIINMPEVQNEVRKYLDTWKIITKTWLYLKQKHSDKILLHGHF